MGETDKYAKLREALWQASPAPWHAGTECPGRCCWHIFQGIPIYNANDRAVVINEYREEDAALMVAARNLLPDLLAERDAQEDKIGRRRLAPAAQLVAATSSAAAWNGTGGTPGTPNILD